MAMPLPYPIHPMSEMVAQIDQGENPWVCLSSFLHDWCQKHRDAHVAHPTRLDVYELLVNQP